MSELALSAHAAARAGLTYEDVFDTAIRDRTALVGVIGLGYAGLPLAVGFAEAGFPVAGVDTNARRTSAVNDRASYLPDVSSADAGRAPAAERINRVRARPLDDRAHHLRAHAALEDAHAGSLVRHRGGRAGCCPYPARRPRRAPVNHGARHHHAGAGAHLRARHRRDRAASTSSSATPPSASIRPTRTAGRFAPRPRSSRASPRSAAAAPACSTRPSSTPSSRSPHPPSPRW